MGLNQALGQLLIMESRNEKRGSRPLTGLNRSLLAEAFTYCNKNQPLLRYTECSIGVDDPEMQAGEVECQ